MNNIIVVGDSFCHDRHGWPKELANQLNLKLICHGGNGQPWWNAQKFLASISSENFDQTEMMVFVHTNAERIPTSNQQIGSIDHSNPGPDEIDQAVKLYYRHIHDANFLIWAQQQWFQYITSSWGNKKICHLHSFPWSLQHKHLLSGVNINTNLGSISLNEMGADKFHLVGDRRSNHLNDHNNHQLAHQLANILQPYTPGSYDLDTSKFDLKTQKWFDWS